jgi:ribonucleoside-diphosphate reductase alpha chain
MVSSPSLSPAALEILERRYLRKDESGRTVETPDHLFRRVAANIAAASDTYGDRGDEEEEFYQAMRSLEFLPNSPTLMNAGTNIQQLSACFVIPVEDSIESIYDAVKFGAIVHQTGGGTGYSFSKIRPEGDPVRSTGGVASGPVSFMRVFDAATDAIKQGGRRRGANMGVLRIDHPDIESFITAKKDLVSFSNFNLSVAVTDVFMDRAAKGEEYELINPRGGCLVRKIPAARVLECIATSAWWGGDPGVLFIDAVNRGNPLPALGLIEATNPCGEVPLLPFEACNLGSINLDRMVTGGEVNWDKLADVVDLGVRFLDNVIDANRYPLVQTAEVVRGNRKIGLGIMGFADMLVRLKIRYGSPSSIKLVDRLMSFVQSKAEAVSRSIAESRGSFPNIGRSIIDGPRRNATVLSIAPTGTISIIAGCSSGIEPYYAISYSRNVMDGRHLKEMVPLFSATASEQGFMTPELAGIVASSQSIRDLHDIPEEVRQVFVTAHDVPAFEQIDLQAAFQRHVDNAVSKTINLPPGGSWREVYEAIVYAHSRGCKGLTVYREGSKPGQVLTTIKDATNCCSCGRSHRGEEGAMQCETSG